MTPNPLAQALDRHKAAYAALSARIPYDEKLAIAEDRALNVLAKTPCTSDAEFLDKLRYLLAYETRINGEPPETDCGDFGSIAVAVDSHFNPRACDDRA